MARVAALGLALLIGLTSCGSDGGAMRLTAADGGTRVSAAVGDTITVELTANPSTGYSWITSEIDPAMLRAVGEPSFDADSDLAGAPGVTTMEFEVLAAGECDLALSYLRVWEDALPLEVFKVTVVVAG